MCKLDQVRWRENFRHDSTLRLPSLGYWVTHKCHTRQATYLFTPMHIYVYVFSVFIGSQAPVWAHFLSLARSKLGLYSANHSAGYFSNLACDWLSVVWADSELATEYGPWVVTDFTRCLTKTYAHYELSLTRVTYQIYTDVNIVYNVEEIRAVIYGIWSRTAYNRLLIYYPAPSK